MIRRIGVLPLVLVILGCGGGGAPGPATPPPSYGGIPDLSGRMVLLFPAQSVRDGLGLIDPEIRFAVEEGGGWVRWVLPEELRRAMARSPAVRVIPDRLSSGVFLRAEVRRVGDPLFGELRRSAALVGAETVLIPVEVLYREGEPGTDGRVEIAAALVDVRSGRVHWFGRVQGLPGDRRDPGVLASAAGELVRRISP